MSTRYKTEKTPATTTQCTFKCVLPDPLPDPPITYPEKNSSLLVPEITRIRKQFWDESWNGDRKTWKNCENYEISHDSQASAGPSGPFIEYASFAPFYSKGTPKNRWARYRLYTYGGSYIDPFGPPGEPTVGLTGLYQPNPIDGTFVPRPDNLDYLNDMALKVMLPSIKADLSLVNAIIELKDFKRLPGLISRLHEIVPFIRSLLKRKNNPLRTFRDLMRVPAETYLTYQFALAPLFDDINGAFAACARYQAQISDLISREGKLQTRHFSYGWQEFPQSLNETSTSQGLDQPGYILTDPLTTWKQKRRTIAEATKFHAEIQFNYNFTEYQRTHAYALGLLDRLGVNLNTQIIWNALPWSFVVDWIIDVNRFLGYYGRSKNMEPVINIHQYLWSVKRKRTIYIDMVAQTTSPYVHDSYVAGSIVPLPVVTETAYRRQVGLPGYSSLTSSGLSPKELSLGAALVFVRGKYRGIRNLPVPYRRH